MRVEYSPGVIVLSFGIANMGAYAAITACEQYRLCRTGMVKSRYLSPSAYLFVMAVCLGGVGIWCMHFVGMSAVTMFDDSGETVPVHYDLGLTLLSLVLVIMFATIGFYISCHDIIFMKTKREILEMFVDNAHGKSMKSVQKFGIRDILPLILTKSTQHLLLGGAFTGSGVVVMHYVGMAAMKFPGRIVWNVGAIAGSVVIAFAASTAAFWILFRLLSIYSNKENLRLACSFTMGVAVCGMHYAGMAAATFVMDPSVGVNTANAFTSHDAFFAGIVVAALVSSLATVMVLADLRYSVLRLSNELYIADALVKGLPAPPCSSSAVAIHRYIHHRRSTQFSLGILNDTAQLEATDDTNSVTSKDEPEIQSLSMQYIPGWVHHWMATYTWRGDPKVYTEEHVESSYSYLEQGRAGQSTVIAKPAGTPVAPLPSVASLQTSTSDEAAAATKTTLTNTTADSGAEQPVVQNGHRLVCAAR